MYDEKALELIYTSLESLDEGALYAWAVKAKEKLSEFYAELQREYENSQYN